jgi:hypothetical protein
VHDTVKLDMLVMHTNSRADLMEKEKAKGK